MPHPSLSIDFVLIHHILPVRSSARGSCRSWVSPQTPRPVESAMVVPRRKRNGCVVLPWDVVHCLLTHPLFCHPPVLPVVRRLGRLHIQARARGIETLVKNPCLGVSHVFPYAGSGRLPSNGGNGTRVRVRMCTMMGWEGSRERCSSLHGNGGAGDVSSVTGPPQRRWAYRFLAVRKAGSVRCRDWGIPRRDEQAARSTARLYVHSALISFVPSGLYHLRTLGKGRTAHAG